MKGKIAVWFSCGAASAVAAKKTIEIYGNTHDIRILNNPVKEEDVDNYRFLKEVEQWLKVKIEFVSNPNFYDCSAVSVWEKRRYMSGTKGAPCTLELKKRARQMWEEKNLVDWHVLGFTYDEKKRHENFIKNERENLLPVLIDEKITKQMCFEIIQSVGIDLPRIYKLGYPNANCIGCAKATSVTYWNHVRKTHPEIFNERARQSREIGCKLTRYKGKRIFLDELPEDARGRAMKSLKSVECGIFCEER